MNRLVLAHGSYAGIAGWHLDSGMPMQVRLSWCVKIRNWDRVINLRVANRACTVAESGF